MTDQSDAFSLAPSPNHLNIERCGVRDGDGRMRDTLSGHNVSIILMLSRRHPRAQSRPRDPGLMVMLITRHNQHVVNVTIIITIIVLHTISFHCPDICSQPLIDG